MKFIVLLLVSGQMLFASETPVLRFDDSITWKQIFDFGFRPKHLVGLESHMCVCQDQSFWVQFKEREPKFKVESGRLAFSLFHDDFLSMVWHQGGEAITLEEGRRRSDEFRKVFAGYIVREITMPRLIDPSGLVEAGKDENNIKARVGKYRITYGFDNSFAKVKPIIPHFYITWSFPGMPDARLKEVTDVVRPPKGYEWYSLDPKVITPDPGSKTRTLAEPEIKAPEMENPNLPRVEVKEQYPKDLEIVDKDKRWAWILGLIGGLLVIAWAVIRKLLNGVGSRISTK